MREGDLASVERVAGAVHPGYPEDGAVFAERLRLYPAGCLVLEGQQDIAGYVFAHPWLLGRPPGLNMLLGRLPIGVDCLYVHDLALMAEARGGGYGGEAVASLARQAVAAGLTCLSLVAVGRSAGFWRRYGFEVGEAVGAGLGTYEGAVFMVRRLGTA